MKSPLRLLVTFAAACLLTFSLGCDPPKPPAAETEDDTTTETETAGDNTTAASDTPAGETP
ncbi:MAG: hypothetical protein AAGJ83_04920 [Planctomycetota bacterium]